MRLCVIWFAIRPKASDDLLGITPPEQGACILASYALNQRIRITIQPDGYGLLLKQSPGLVVAEGTSTCGNDAGLTGGQPSNNPSFAVSEMLFAVFCKNLAYAHLRSFLDLFICIAEWQLQDSRQLAPNSGFTDPHHAD